MTIGERLEEARKQRGMSIREAAEATKVRGEYLLAMEENDMARIELPEIYRRGFLKNYARLLKLDPDKIIADYEAKQISQTEVVPERSEREGPPREVFGRLELSDDEVEGVGVPEAQNRPAEHARGGTRQNPPRRPSLNITDNSLYLKIAGGAAAVLVLALLIVLLVNLLRGDPTPDLEPEMAAGGGTTTSAPAGGGNQGTNVQSAPESPSSLTIRAQESVTLIIDQENPAERLYQGTLGAGDVIPIEKEGSVSIRFSNGEALLIELPNGRTIRPNQSSIGRIVVP